MRKKRLLIVSFDAVCSDELKFFDENSRLGKLIKGGSLFDKTKSIFVSNTYPVHTSVSTGRLPVEHGLIANTALEPESNHGWNWDSRKIKTKTLWQAAYEKGYTTAAVSWPVTGYAKQAIKFNLPEILAGPEQNQVLENLKAGSVFFQLRNYFKFRHLLDAEDVGKQPNKDNFTTAIMVDTLLRHKCDLMLFHLTEYDSATHVFGRYSSESYQALEHLDNNLAQVMDAAGEDVDTIVFSDHSQINFDRVIDPNLALGCGFAQKPYFYYSGGCCFCFPRDASSEEIESLKASSLSLEGVDGVLSEAQMHDSGFSSAGAAFGLSAKEGFIFDTEVREKAEHGYTLEREHYGTFIATSWKENSVPADVRDVTRLASQRLGLDYKDGLI